MAHCLPPLSAQIMMDTKPSVIPQLLNGLVHQESAALKAALCGGWLVWGQKLGDLAASVGQGWLRGPHPSCTSSVDAPPVS